MEEKVTGRRGEIIGTKIDRGELKNSTGNGEAKDLTCTTHGRDLMGMLVGGGVQGGVE